MLENNSNNVLFHVQRIYTKDISFEAPSTPAVFQINWSPKIKVDLNSDAKKIHTDLYEVVLCITVIAKIGEDTAFLCQVKQAGIFHVAGLNKTQMVRCFSAHCPSILFPYASECISSQVSRGTFPQINLNPINFDTLFIQSLYKKYDDTFKL
ncbi:protein-export chaperone SecB [Blochmannia endosymbiont of Camponotus sp. C-003]|uniref:protein-export chaperone SecB n=1 Tax=unclassified Candidatus Blochmanniella TaxID=711328 RepID=UPI00202547BF|nr:MULTISPECIES: protein-export chaperone SecB [unclassified Candidatus Blochmannia]URJ23253.1 protein-export chaperone SecB [Blochmannia endosymbiont of Camponotus sp. C-003]URJ28722.1 protein-export chaperone SecB [Blochmannia endosymbiont of Camponotus sp. C-046]